MTNSCDSPTNTTSCLEATPRKTRKLAVQVPITGFVYAEVEVPEEDADDEDVIFGAVVDAHDAHPDDCEVVWEMVRHMSEGVVSHAELDDITWKDVNDPSDNSGGQESEL